jgi:hypothetical protein
LNKLAAKKKTKKIEVISDLKLVDHQLEENKEKQYLLHGTGGNTASVQTKIKENEEEK